MSIAPASLKRFSQLLAACALSVTVMCPAKAVTHATAELSKLHIQLIDLDAADGISPSLELLPSSLDMRTVYGGDNTGSYNVYDRLAGSLDPVHIALAKDRFSGSLTVTGSGGVEGISIAGTSELASPSVPSIFVYVGTIYSLAQLFYLSPRTELLLSGDVSVQATVDPGDAAKVGAMSHFGLWTPNEASRFERRLDLTHGSDLLQASGTLRLSNLGPERMWGAIELSNNTNALVVPEPASWLMTLAGCALLVPLACKRGTRR